MPIEVRKYNQNGEELAIRFGLGAIKAVGVSMMEDIIKNRQKNDKKFKDLYDFAANAGAKAINKKALEALAKSGSFDSIHQNRNQIVESVDIICKYAASKDEEKNSNQMSLFSSAEIIDENPALKAADDWKKEKKLQEEFKAFGFFLNEHPIDDFLDSLARRGVVSSENLEELEDGNIAKFAGVVAYSKHKSGPKGRYAYIILSDPFGIYEASIFDEAIITSHRDKMADGNSLVIECLIKKDQGGSRLLVKSIENLEEFIKNHYPKKEAYKDIKQQERKTEFDWKKKNKKQQADAVVYEVEYQRKIFELRNRKIVKEIIITINNRQNILDLKSFLSQRLAPKDFEEFSTVYFAVNNPAGKATKIDTKNKYLITKEDIEKIKLFTEVLITE